MKATPWAQLAFTSGTKPWTQVNSEFSSSGKRKNVMPEVTAACTEPRPGGDHQHHPDEAEEEGEALVVVGLAGEAGQQAATEAGHAAPTTNTHEA